MTNSSEAEQSVLGAIIKDGTFFEEVRLEKEHFHTKAHGVIYEAMNEVNKKDKPIDLVTIIDELGDKVSQVGNFTYLTKLAESVATFESLSFHEDIIIESYQARELRKIASENVKNPSHEKISETIKQLEDLQSLSTKDIDMSYQDHLKELADEMGSVKDLSQLGYKTGFRDYDDLTGGLQKSDLIIVGARASIGKTAFGLNMAAQHCKDGGTTHFFTLEMPTKDLIKRFINMTGSIESSAWHTSTFSTEDYTKGIQAIGIMSEWNMNIYENTKSVNDIKTIMRKEIQQNPNERHLVVIDYLGQFEKRGGFDRNDLEVGDNVKQCKSIAKDHDIPVVLLTQINRGVEQRQDKRPMMSDLKDSGEIEQTADVVALLYRDDYYSEEGESDTGIIEILIRKQRDGPQGKVELSFIKEYGRFADLPN